jgi:hypothetical protein
MSQQRSKRKPNTHLKAQPVHAAEASVPISSKESSQAPTLRILWGLLLIAVGILGVAVYRADSETHRFDRDGKELSATALVITPVNSCGDSCPPGLLEREKNVVAKVTASIPVWPSTFRSIFTSLLTGGVVLLVDGSIQFRTRSKRS